MLDRKTTRIPDRWAFGALIGLAAALALLPRPVPPPTAASAGERYELRICNNSSEPRIYAAVAAYDPALRRLVARGWFPQTSGACRAVLRELVPPVYVFGESQDGARRWGGDGGVEFCLRGDAPFVASEGGCAVDGRVFRKLEIEGGRAVQTWAIEDEARS